VIATEDFDQVCVASQEELRQWLLTHHTQPESVWLVTYKKNVPDKYIGRWDVLDELICFGWIDGIRRKLDEHRTMQLISPRKVQHWAKSYKDRASKLIANGRMHAHGLRSIEVGKASGLWNFMDDVDRLEIPSDLEKALKEQPDALPFFEALNASSKRNALRWVKLAKTAPTRQKRVADLARLSAAGKKLSGS
jgi:uncharacterized protein YdeI (YjbR/CyaY-like superfamily)